MIALLQRVSEASVVIAGNTEAAIGVGILALIAIERHDDATLCRRMAQRLLGYRIFADDRGRMNRSVTDIGGEVLCVPQFTLAADTRKGLRPSFSSGGDAAAAKQWFETVVACAVSSYPKVKAGCFQTDMQVALINDGPATFLLKVRSHAENAEQA